MKKESYRQDEVSIISGLDVFMVNLNRMARSAQKARLLVWHCV